MTYQESNFRYCKNANSPSILTGLERLELFAQCVEKVVSDSPGGAGGFVIGLVIFVLNLPDRQVLFFGEIQNTEGL